MRTFGNTAGVLHFLHILPASSGLPPPTAGDRGQQGAQWNLDGIGPELGIAGANVRSHGCVDSQV